MQKRKIRKFTKEFKEKAVELALNSSDSDSKVADSLGIPHSTLVNRQIHACLNQ